MAKSLQDRLQQRRSSTFIGREQQLELFRQNLLRPIDSDDYYFIFNIYGQGGIGKTTLLHKFQEIAKSQGALVAYSGNDLLEVPDLLVSLARQINGNKNHFSKLEGLYRIYLQEKKRLEADPEAPKSTWSFGGRLLASGGRELVRNFLPGAGILIDQVNIEAIGEQVGEWASFLKKKVTNEDEVELLLNPISVLTPLFLEGLRTYANINKICICFDVYEETDIYLDEWLRQLLEGKYGDAPDNLLIIIAGRKPLSANSWSPFADLITSISLEPFNGLEARSYLERKRVQDPSTIDTIIQLSGCLPVLLEILAEKAPQSPEDVNDPCDTAVERFLGWIKDPILRELALYGALPNYLNEDIIGHLSPEVSQSRELFSWLIKNSFVYRRGDNWVYHQFVKELIQRYLWQLSASKWQKLNEEIADYFNDKLKNCGIKSDTSGWRNKAWKSYLLEYQYHKLLANFNLTLPEVIQTLAKVLREQGVYEALKWVEILSQAAKLTRNTYWSEILKLGLSAFISKNWGDALNLFSTINRLGWIEEKEDSFFFLFLEGYCLHQQNLFEDAINIYKQAILLKPNDSDVHNNLGNILKAQRQFDAAIAEYHKAIELKEEAEPYYNLGNTYCQQKKFEEAIICYKKAIDLNPEYPAAYNNLGFSLLSLGEAEEAELNLTMVWNKYDDKNKYVSINLGHANVLKGKKEEAILWYLRSLRLRHDKESFFQVMISDFHDLGMQSRISIDSFNKMLEDIKAATSELDFE